ncbi:MAG: hypothetical protein ACRDG3_03700, partial [Tepidiformaceae bacterium]
AIVVAIMVLAFTVQPGGAAGKTSPSSDTPSVALGAATTTAITAPQPTSTPQALPTVATRGPNGAPLSPTAPPSNQSTVTPNATPGTGNGASGTPPAQSTATDQVEGIQGTPGATAQPTDPGATPTAEPDFSHQSTECGSLQEISTPVSIQQAINGVAVQAQSVATYPADYFSCILMATGGTEAISLSQAVLKAKSSGMTDIVLIDLWITDAGTDFGQISLKDSVVAAAGQTFAPIATLGGRADVVVSSGQGRNVTLVVAVKNSLGGSLGPMTLTVNGPMVGGTQVAGKYQLFLPTP